ncbi:MAG: ABC-2 transporter permease [Coriobacteriia bacterium]|nr:ABC-2 transporter permease [Coriobacteriia bacterium]
MSKNFYNTFPYLRLILKRERVVSAVWLVGLFLFSALLSGGISRGFDDEARQALAMTLQNPGVVSMMGPVYGADNYTAGAMYTNTMMLWVIIAVAIMNAFYAVRHTRSDEESGRSEVLRSLPTGRLTSIHATMIGALIINVIFAITSGLGICLMGDQSMGLASSLLYAFALAATGFLFASVALLFSQLSASSRGALIFSLITLGCCYVLRAAGDIGNETLSLISPLGLIQRSKPFVENNILPLALVFGEAIAIAAIAYALNSIRDLGHGFIAARKGAKSASPYLLSSLGLAFRLVRTTTMVWLVTMLALSASYGSILADIDTFVAKSDLYKLLLGVNDQYSTAMMFAAMVSSITALISLAAVLTVGLKPRTEEREGFSEGVLSKAVPRLRYIGAYTLIAFAFSILMQAIAAFGLYLAASLVLPKTASIGFGYLLKASFVYLPAIWVVLGLAVLLIGLAPKATTAIWGYYAFCFCVSFATNVMALPKAIRYLSPFSFVPKLPVETLRIESLLALSLVAGILAVCGLIAYHRRESAY